MRSLFSKFFARKAGADRQVAVSFGFKSWLVFYLRNFKINSCTKELLCTAVLVCIVSDANMHNYLRRF